MFYKESLSFSGFPYKKIPNTFLMQVKLHFHGISYSANRFVGPCKPKQQPPKLPLVPLSPSAPYRERTYGAQGQGSSWGRSCEMPSSRLPRSTAQFAVGDRKAFANRCDQSATASSKVFKTRWLPEAYDQSSLLPPSHPQTLNFDWQHMAASPTLYRSMWGRTSLTLNSCQAWQTTQSALGVHKATNHHVRPPTLFKCQIQLGGT